MGQWRYTDGQQDRLDHKYIISTADKTETSVLTIFVDDQPMNWGSLNRLINDRLFFN